MNKHPSCDCENCPLETRSYVSSMMPELQQYPVYWVGQAPGQTETFTGIPFTGSAGKTHWSICKSVGLNKTLLPHLNVINCWPPEDRVPMLNEIRCCHERLKQELHGQYWDEEILDFRSVPPPKLIVALGDTAVSTLTGLRGITQQRGRIVDALPEFELDVPVLCSYHPSYCLRRRQFIPIQAETYQLVLDFLNDSLPKSNEPELVLDPYAEDLFNYLQTDQVVACDTETTGLNHRKDSIIGFSFSKSSQEAVAILFTGPDDPRWSVVIEFLKNPRRKKIWQNGSFDTGMIRYSEANPEIINDLGFFYDTRLAEQLLSSDLPTNLDYLRERYTMIKPYKPSKKEIAKISTWGKERMLKYAALDAVTTYAVYENQSENLSEKEKSLIEHHLIPLVYAIGRMQNRGVLVDVNALSALYSQIAEGLVEPERRFAELGINPRSPKQVADKFGLKSTNKKTLDRLIKRGDPNSEVFEMLLEYRTYQKLGSTYLKGIYSRLEDGRIHTEFKLDGTGTGRLSSSDPNLQNVPELMRIIYIPDPGCCFVKADYSQIELWVGAILAEEWDMLKDLQSGLDIHYISCQICFPRHDLTGSRSHDYSKREQIIAKAVTFGTFYGRTARSIAVEFGVTTLEAEAWQMRLINKYPGLLNYKHNCETAMQSRGYVETPFGRKRYVTKVTQGYNAPVQSTASDITLGAIIEADRVGLLPMISVHDDILYQVSIENFDQEFKAIRAVQERPIPELHNIQFKTSYYRGMNWYEMEEVKDDRIYAPTPSST